MREERLYLFFVIITVTRLVLFRLNIHIYCVFKWDIVIMWVHEDIITGEDTGT